MNFVVLGKLVKEIFCQSGTSLEEPFGLGHGGSQVLGDVFGLDLHERNAAVEQYARGSEVLLEVVLAR